jgi:inosine/xanthosine triphosphatase
MQKVVIASKNPVKINAVSIGFNSVFSDEEFEFVTVSVPSGISDQPMSDSETYQGAKNRTDNAFSEVSDADYYVGIEGGVELFESEMMSIAWVVIRSGDKYGKAKTETFFLPKEIGRLIKNGKELGEVSDIFFQRSDSKQGCGTVGILTGNVIDRTKYYSDAVILALIPFINPGLY